MKPIDRIMRQNVPGYAYMKEAIPQAAEREPKKKRQQKPRTLTEIAGSGKAVLRKGVTLTQAARKLNRYEETGLAPQEVFNLIERAHNPERRVANVPGLHGQIQPGGGAGNGTGIAGHCPGFEDNRQNRPEHKRINGSHSADRG